MTSLRLNRREFMRLTTLGSSGLVLGFCLPWSGCKRKPGNDGEFRPSVWLRIDRDGMVTVTVHRSEMGQKVWTALPMIVAEELEADWSRIRVVQGDLDPQYGRQTTGGSASIRTSYETLRRAGAVAREMLLTAAAETWKVARGECRAENGFIIHTPSGRRLAYGDLVDSAARLPVPAAESVPLKAPGDFKIIGRDFKSLDTASKVDGSLVFGYDFKLPGMLTAVVARCPVFGGTVVDFEDRAAKAVPGVRDVVTISSGVAVLAENTWAALKGREALVIRWDEGANADLSSPGISARLRQGLDGPGTVLRHTGDAPGSWDRAARRLEAEYEVPYLDHAPMEPMNCTAHLHDGRCEIWAPTQNPSAAQQAAMGITQLSEDQVIVHLLRLGGGFGRRLAWDFVQDAVEVARHTAGPVKVIRTRDEDLRHGVYRPATIHRIQGALDQAGQPLVWRHRISGPEDEWPGLITGGADELAYAIPNVLVDYVMTPIPVPIGPWRSVANTQNALVNECFLDELAAAAGKDPCDFRRALLKDQPRHLGVLNLAAEKAGWGPSLPAGHFQGIAVHKCFHSYAAVVAEIALSPAGKLTIPRMVCAIDCGLVINPDGVRAQVEGGITLGLTAALYGAITLENGRVQQSNFHDYKLLSMAEAPMIETHIVPSSAPPTGAGEPPVPPTPPALLNAIFAATGKRIRSLPLKDQSLR